MQDLLQLQQTRVAAIQHGPLLGTDMVGKRLVCSNTREPSDMASPFLALKVYCLVFEVALQTVPQKSFASLHTKIVQT